MDKGELIIKLFIVMMEKDWNFPFDENLPESQPEQWDNNAIKRAVSQADKILETFK